MLERYTGSSLSEFQPYILLVNFRKYLELFAKKTKSEVTHGSAMSICHCKKEKITMINYGLGSPLAALIVSLLPTIKPKASIMLGMCGGLRSEYGLGDFFSPVAAIREEGTSNAYMPPRCPSLSSFTIQRYICDELDKQKKKYHSGVIHTTNVRLWEFNEDFKRKLAEERSQAIDMECATLFTVGFAHNIPIGALMLISDLPLEHGGIKTKKSMHSIFDNFSGIHIDTGINVIRHMIADKGKFEYHF